MPSTYDILFNSGARLCGVSAETAFQAVTVPEVELISDHECGHIVWPFVENSTSNIEEPDEEPIKESVEEPNEDSDEVAILKYYEQEYKYAYLMNKLVGTDDTSEELARVKRECLLRGLTDVVFFFADEQCDQRFKLYNRGLITSRELLDMSVLNSVCF